MRSVLHLALRLTNDFIGGRARYVTSSVRVNSDANCDKLSDGMKRAGAAANMISNMFASFGKFEMGNYWMLYAN